jgi:hypothetical protein
MAEMVQPKYGYKVIERSDHTEVRYDKASGGSGVVYIFSDKIQVGGVAYAKEGIGGVYSKIPDLIAKEAGHVPAPNTARSPITRSAVGLGAAVGAMVKNAQMDRANREEWSVCCTFGEEEEIVLASGFNQARANSLERVFSRLIHS